MKSWAAANKWNADERAIEEAEDFLSQNLNVPQEEFEKKGDWTAKRLSVYPETIELFKNAWNAMKGGEKC